MSGIPSYYNNFKKQEVQETVDIKKAFIGALALLGLTGGAIAQDPVNIENLQVARRNLFENQHISGDELTVVRQYVKVLEARVLQEGKEDKKLVEEKIKHSDKAQENVKRAQEELTAAQKEAKAASNAVIKAKKKGDFADTFAWFLSGVFAAGED